MGMTHKLGIRLALCAAICAMALSVGAGAQVGKGVLDANYATEPELLKGPHMTLPIVKGLIAARNFNSIVDLNKYLLGAGLTQDQAMQFYTYAFVHVNLNTGTRDEILLVPGAGRQMAREFVEYRPWKSWAQFDKEIGKYVGQEATDKLKRYVFIPIDLNNGTDEDFMTIPGVGSRMVREFKEYRPWKSKAQFDKEIGKYVNQKEVDRLWRFVTIAQ